MIGASVADNLTTLGLGFLATLGVVIVGWWQFGRTTKTVQETKAVIGEIDARDESDDMTIVEMLREILRGQTGQDARLAAHDALHAAHDRRLVAHDDLHAEHAARLAEHAEMIRRLQGES